MFKKILIANRGEIAVRIIKTCKKLRIKTVAVFSEIDSRSVYVREADEAVPLRDSSGIIPYLNKEEIIRIGLELECDGIHPGYGFLSENPEFAEMVTASGMKFIGPPADVIARMGDKIAAKLLAKGVGLPVVPGNDQPIENLEGAKKIAETIGYPILLKPAGGGGGRGMRIVRTNEELPIAFRESQEETRKPFGDKRVFVEQYITDPRHIEVQIIADSFGNVIHLGERECSIQRRYQKIIEEAPSSAVTIELRNKLGEMACALAKEVGYINAGTVEFILDHQGNFYFMEMNTRLQVEHPVTEMVTGFDLVELQLRIADGEPLPLKQENIKIKGWATEARICAEDPSRGFLPSTGMITRYALPMGKNIRTDSGIEAGSLVTVHYDSMLAKIIAWGETREESIKSLIQALNRSHIEGVVTNIDFLNAILNHPDYLKGEISTSFIDEHFKEGRADISPPVKYLHFMAIASTLVYHNRQNLVRLSLKPMIAKVGHAHRRKRGVSYVVQSEGVSFQLRLAPQPQTNRWNIEVDGKDYDVITPKFEFYRRRLKLTINGEVQYFRMQYQGNFIWVAFSGITQIFEIYKPREWELARYMLKKEKVELSNVLVSPMPGLVVGINVKRGDRVYRGQDLIVLESMKMEMGVSSPCDGVVDEIKIKEGQAIEAGDTLITFK